MKIKSVFLFTLIVTMLFFSSADIIAAKGGEILKETRNLPSFTSIQSNSSVDIIITQGQTQSVVVEADAKLIPHLFTEVRNGVLYVDIKSYHRQYRVAKLHIRIPMLEKVSLNGSGDLAFADTFKSIGLKISLNGSGDFRGDLDVKQLELEIAGSGDAVFSGVSGSLKVFIGGSGDVSAKKLRLSDCHVKIAGSGDMILKGNTEDLVLGLAGSGDVDAYDLKAVNVSVSIAGSGDVGVYAVESISASIVGSGNVNYSGNPTKVNVSSTGSGSLTKN
jgi:hypothetical protein